jgi:hypothetical protein
MSSGAIEFYSNEFDEISEVVRTVDVAHKNLRYRIQILQGYSNPQIPFSAKCWIEEEIEIHPIWTEQGKESAADSKKKINVLRRIELPWVSRETSESALQQALSFLKQKVG